MINQTALNLAIVVESLYMAGGDYGKALAWAKKSMPRHIGKTHVHMFSEYRPIAYKKCVICRLSPKEIMENERKLSRISVIKNDT